MRKNGIRLLAFALVLSMVCALLPFAAFAADSVLAGFDFTAAPASLPVLNTTEGGYGALNASVTGTPEYTSKALSLKNWQEGDCWAFAFNTSGCTGLKLTAKLMSTNTAPKNWSVEYSLDNGERWTQTETYTLENSLKQKTFDLPDAAQSDNLLVRLRVTDGESVNGGALAASGASKINGVSLTGTVGEGRLPDPETPIWPENLKGGTVELLETPEPGPGTQGTLAQWQMTGAVMLPAAATSGWGTLSHTSSTYSQYSGGALSEVGWKEGAYWQFVVNTSGATGMKLAFKASSSNAGPKNFALRYSTDLGETWNDFEGNTISLTTSLKQYTISLPDAAQSRNLVLRLVVLNSESVGGGEIAANGNSKLNNVDLSGLIDEAAHEADPETPAYPADWNAPIHYNIDDVFVPAAEEAADAASWQTEETDRRTIARWGGNVNYEGAMLVYGDLISANDRLDGTAVLTTVVNGVQQSPGLITIGGNGKTFYLGSGSPCIGSGSAEDYIQLQVRTAKYADLGLRFRLRVSGSGPKAFTAKFSVDGENWLMFDTGSYAYAYTAYGAGGLTYEVSGEGSVEGGVLPMKVDSQYISFVLDVPKQAENAKNLYIRLYASQERADGKDGTVSEGASVRIDTVELTGCPMIADSIVDWVRTDTPASVPIGAQLLLTCGTEGATIHYSFDNGRTDAVYDPANPPALNAYPAYVTVWAVKEGLTPSVRTLYTFTQEQVGPVKATPNGGAVAEGTELKLTCATEGAQIEYAMNGGAWTAYDPAQRPVLTRALLEAGLTCAVRATKSGCLPSPVSQLIFSLRQNAEYHLYFGQLHSHTNYSDGAGSCEEAFIHASTEVSNLDFLAVTDHSNAFDNDLACSLADGEASSEWIEGHALADKYTTDSFVGIYGYEMTWSNGLGHMNTYNTPGFQSRTQTAYSSYATALKNYYDTLRTDTNSISQFNHPGTTFGTFQDYAYYDSDIDELITIIEVGNGEGTIGSSGYFPSYEEYTRALDLGWHVAPTNNQDNHKGSWGDANTARSVVMADSLTRSNIYDAIRNRRVYATEDNDLHIYYTLNGYEMGTILTGEDVDDEVVLRAKISDLTDSGNCKVEVIVNGGLIAATKSVPVGESEVVFNLPANYSYYYLRVTQADKDKAVTAPVWIGEVEAIGIKEFSCDTDLPVQNEPTEITMTISNEENQNLSIESIEFYVDLENGEKQTVHTVDLAAAELTELKAHTTRHYWFDFQWDGIGTTVLCVTVKASLDGVEKQYNGKLTMKYLPPSMVSNVIVDGTHFNDYVTGAYAGNTTKLSELGAANYAKVRVVTDEITPELLKNCDLLVLSAPAKRTLDGYHTSHFEEAFLSTVADYVANGGSVIVCGAADYNDSTACQTHTEINKLLDRLGATIRLRSDEVVEKDDKGTYLYGLELGGYDAASPWLEAAQEGMTFSVYSACSLDLSQNAANDKVNEAKVLITGNPETFSIDVKKDSGYSVTVNEGAENPVVVPAGEVVMAAVQDTKAGGHIFLVGSVFFSDYNMETDEHDYKLNAVLTENILKNVGKALEVTPIAEMRQGELGEVFCIEGWVTNGTDNENTKFFDTIYLQDETGGVTIYPFAEAGLRRGTKMQIVGYVDEYQDDRELQVLRYEILDDADLNIMEPTALSCADAMDYANKGGLLVKTQGEIIEVSYQGESVTQLRLKDETGVATVFIDGYIYSGTTGLNELAAFCKEGNTVSAVGMCYMHPETGSDVSSCCLRVRDCDEIVLIAEAGPDPVHDDELVTAIERAEDVHPDWYTPATAAVLEEALAVGRAVLAKENPTQAEIDAAARAIEEALAALIAKWDACDGEDLCPGSAFTDMPAHGNWAHKAIDWAIVTGVTNGATPTTFNPGGDCTRGHVVTFLWRAAGCPAPQSKNNPFKDVAEGQYYYDAVLWAVEKGITNGLSKTTFGPNNPCTRGQIVTFLYRFAGCPDVTPGPSKFTDVAEGTYYQNAVQWAVEHKITYGLSETTFGPNNTCIRAQVVTFLFRLVVGDEA